MSERGGTARRADNEWRRGGDLRTSRAVL